MHPRRTAQLKVQPEQKHTGGEAVLEMVLPPGRTGRWQVRADGGEKSRASCTGVVLVSEGSREPVKIFEQKELTRPEV